MKNIFSILVVFLIICTGFNAESQNTERFPRLHERIVQAKLREIRLQLKLDQSTFDQFRPVYIRYEKEITGIDFRNLARLMIVDADSLSSDEADQMIVNQMETSKKLIAIRERYYKEFRTVISPQKIIKLYQSEGEIRKMVLQEMKRRIISR